MAFPVAVGLAPSPVATSPLYSPALRLSRSGSRAVCTISSVSRLGPCHDRPSLRSSARKEAAALKDGGFPRRLRSREAFCVRASSDDSDVKTENGPSWAKLDSGEVPPWARNEAGTPEPTQLRFAFAIYLVGSAIVAIAAVGSIFEWFNRHPIFGLIATDNILYTPILAFFAISGLPTAGYLFYKSITLANKASEQADKEDGFTR